jgi:uncharacterized SAM-binding protein YcdF (DUF218 family)
VGDGTPYSDAGSRSSAYRSAEPRLTLCFNSALAIARPAVPRPAISTRTSPASITVERASRRFVDATDEADRRADPAVRQGLAVRSVHGRPINIRIMAKHTGCCQYIGVELLGKGRRRFPSLLTRLGARSSLGLALSGIFVGYFAFDNFAAPTKTQIHGASAAVVFTGQFERVDAGLRLLNARAVPRLYISGVNGGAGILRENFVQQFAARNPDIVSLDRVVACCVQFGELADNTFQNAADTKCWVDRNKITGPLLLVTSQSHIARAKAALSSVLPRIAILPYPVKDEVYFDGRARMKIYLKYLVTVAASFVPFPIDPEQKLGPFADGCPDQL